MTYIKRLHLLCGISLLICELPRDFVNPAAPLKILVLTHFSVLECLQLDVTNSLAHCYVFFTWGTYEEHLTDTLSVAPFISCSNLFFIGNAE
jgi:hypothetical protein